MQDLEEASRLNPQEAKGGSSARYEKHQKRQEKSRKQGSAMEVTAEDIAEVISDLDTGFRSSRLTEERERAAAVNLEAILHKRVIGQEEAVSQRCAGDARDGQMSDCRIRDDRSVSFLFLGPTGVGKDGAVQGAGRSDVWFRKRA